MTRAIYFLKFIVQTRSLPLAVIVTLIVIIKIRPFGPPLFSNIAWPHTLQNQNLIDKLFKRFRAFSGDSSYMQYLLNKGVSQYLQ